MDSKIKQKAILICVALLLLLGTGIVIVNYRNGNLTSGRRADTARTEEGSQTEAGNQGEHADEPDAESLKDFLKDPSFFNREELEPVKPETVDAVRVTLSCHSSYRDLRVQIVDPQGELVTGIPFEVLLNGKDRYADQDKDGFIWIRGLSAGDYSIELAEVEGFRVPLVPVKVQVTDTIAFRYISDIALMIRQESEINVGAEDSGSHHSDADETAPIEILPREEGVTFGVDVSSRNGEIDWTKVQASGVEFAYIRCGYRGMTTGELIEDAMFRRNVKDAMAVGIKVGIYISSQAITELEAVEEASMAICLAREYAVTYPVFIEMESSMGQDGRESRADGLDRDTRTAVIAAFCETMENAGYRTGVMATASWLDKEIEMRSLNKFYVYLGEYRAKPTYKGTYVFWRYTEDAWIEGISGRTAVVAGYY